MGKIKQVTKEEFDTFIENYPNKLTTHVSHIITPPVRSYNDFSDGKEFPDSIVASISLNWLGKDGEIASDDNPDEFWDYYIKEES